MCSCILEITIKDTFRTNFNLRAIEQKRVGEMELSNTSPSIPLRVRAVLLVRAVIELNYLIVSYRLTDIEKVFFFT